MAIRAEVRVGARCCLYVLLDSGQKVLQVSAGELPLKGQGGLPDSATIAGRS